MADRGALPVICVLTVTRRATSIHRCLASVARQDYLGTIEHLVLVDGDDDVFNAWRRATQSRDESIHFMARTPEDKDGPARLAYLRNMAVGLARHEFVTFLDDDNAWSPNHVSSLVSALLTRSGDVAHSHRLMYEHDGRPYLQLEFPWKRERSERQRIYRLYADLGIVTPGCNVLRDFVGMPHSCVDLGEWLLTRELLNANPFVGTYSFEDWQTITVEDAKLEAAIRASGASVACSNSATLHYYLGGYSNNFSADASIYWQPPRSMGWRGTEAGD